MIMFRFFSIRRFYNTEAVKSFYEVLSIPRNATTEEIKAAYYKKAKDCHPDISRGSATEFQRLRDAYETLNDPVKRRAYDATTRPHPSEIRFHETKGPEMPIRHNPVEFRKDYIQHVYKTINREELEVPKFRPFEDHHYPGSEFNRFEYSRKWDKDSSAWVYTKRPTAKAYEESIKAKTAGLNLFITVITAAIVINLLLNRFAFNDYSHQPSRTSRDIERESAGIYIIPDANRP